MYPCSVLSADLGQQSIYIIKSLIRGYAYYGDVVSNVALQSFILLLLKFLDVLQDCAILMGKKNNQRLLGCVAVPLCA